MRLFRREDDVLPDDGQVLAEGEERRRDPAAEERRTKRRLVEAERGVVLRELVRRDRGLRGDGRHLVQHRGVGERRERRVRRRERLHRGDLLRPDRESVWSGASQPSRASVPTSAT